MATTAIEDLTRNAVTKRIKAALVKRSGIQWSVTGGQGTAYGWIKITAPASRNPTNWMSESECKRLARLLGLTTVHPQGEDIPAGHNYYREYIDRAEGRAPSVVGTPYWD